MVSIWTKAADRTRETLKRFQPIPPAAKQRDINESDVVVPVTALSSAAQRQMARAANQVPRKQPPKSDGQLGEAQEWLIRRLDRRVLRSREKQGMLPCISKNRSVAFGSSEQASVLIRRFDGSIGNSKLPVRCGVQVRDLKVPALLERGRLMWSRRVG
jgi:hypothetical protein